MSTSTTEHQQVLALRNMLAAERLSRRRAEKCIAFIAHLGDGINKEEIVEWALHYCICKDCGDKKFDSMQHVVSDESEVVTEHYSVSDDSSLGTDEYPPSDDSE